MYEEPICAQGYVTVVIVSRDSAEAIEMPDEPVHVLKRLMSTSHSPSMKRCSDLSDYVNLQFS